MSQIGFLLYLRLFHLIKEYTLFFVNFKASIIFKEFPDVEIAKRISFFVILLSNCFEKYI